MTNYSIDILAKEDIAIITESFGGIYQWLETHRREGFTSNQRLVLYSQYVPSTKMLEKLIHACEIINITPCFIQLQLSQDISDQLSKLFANVSQYNQFDYIIINNIKSREFNADSVYLSTTQQTLCPLPWAHIEINATGKLTTCCRTKNTLGDIRVSPLHFAQNVMQLVDLRQSMLDGKKHPSCSYCWDAEKYDGGNSLRQSLLSFNKRKFFTKWLDQISLRSLDLKIGNLCNYKCRICNPSRSSQIAAEIMKYGNENEYKKIKIVVEELKWFDQFLKEFQSVIENLDNLNILGGEPFLIKQLEFLLDTMIQSGYSQQIRLHFSTNGSIFPSKIIDKLKLFRQVDIGLSIDDIGERFNFQRTGEWNEVEINIKKFANLDPKIFNIYLFPTISIMNVYYLDQLIEWAEDQHVKISFNENTANFLIDPWYLNINNMTEAAKKIVIDKYSNSDHLTLQAIVNQIKKSPGSNGQEFCSYMKKLDGWRNENFSDHHKAIAHAMGYMLLS